MTDSTPLARRTWAARCILPCALLALLSVPTTAAAEEPYWFPLEDTSAGGVEISASWPIIPGGLAANGTLTLWRADTFSGELVLGAQGDFPQVREDEGTFANLAALIGYRQFFVAGLHLELAVLPGVGFLEGSPHTGLDYTSFDIELAAMIGYRLDVVRIDDVTLYANLQGGVRYVAFKSDPWPLAANGSTEETPIPVGNLLLGIRFR